MISKKYYSLLFAILMSIFMTLVMSGTITFINLGLVDGFIYIWIIAFLKGVIIAMPTAIAIVPVIRKIVDKICST